MKKWFNLAELLPAVAVGMAVVLGLQMTTPTLNKVVWPEEPNITVEAKEKKDKKEDKSSKEKETKAGVGDYKDGVFTGTGVGYGGHTTVQVTVEQKQITAVDVLSHNDTASFFNKAKDSIINEILTAQTWEVDSVSGATYSSRGIKDAVCNALTGKVSDATKPEQVGPKNSLSNDKFVVGTWNDGSYEGSANGFGGKIRVSVTIKDGKITSIKVLSHSGETSSYYNKASKMISRILKAQTPNVDTVSGATYSSTGIREAVKKALTKAAGKKTKTKKTKKKTSSTKTDTLPVVNVPTGTPADGTYTGTSFCEQAPKFSYSVTVSATYKDGKLISLSLKTTDDGSNTSYINRAWDTLQTELLSDMTGNVDTVSRATYSSNAIRTAYKLAYKSAIEANGGTLDDPIETTEESAETKSDDNSSADTDSASSTTEANPGDSDIPVNFVSGSNNGEASLTGTPADGTYLESVTVNSNDASKSNQRGWFTNYNISGKVTFKDGELTDISNITILDADEYEWDDDQAYTDRASNSIIASLKKAQNNEVDTVSGATCSSKAIIALYEKAFKEAAAAYDNSLTESTDLNLASVIIMDTIMTPGEKKSLRTDTAPISEDKTSESSSNTSDVEKEDKDADSSEDKKEDKDKNKSDDKKENKSSDSSTDKKEDKDSNSSTNKKEDKDSNSSANKKEDKDSNPSADQKENQVTSSSEDQKEDQGKTSLENKKEDQNADASDDQKEEKITDSSDQKEDQKDSDKNDNKNVENSDEKKNSKDIRKSDDQADGKESE